MTNQQILEKAIQKAIDGGWLDTDNAKEYADWILRYEDAPSLYDVIFNHDFAKALWPEPNGRIGTPIWKMKLQQMVIADDPIKYLGEHLA